MLSIPMVFPTKIQRMPNLINMGMVSLFDLRGAYLVRSPTLFDIDSLYTEEKNCSNI
jgi:hypothetical protein